MGGIDQEYPIFNQSRYFPGLDHRLYDGNNIALIQRSLKEMFDSVPITDEIMIHHTGPTNTNAGGYQTQGIYVEKQDAIYFAPKDATKVAKINCSDKTVEFVGPTLDGQAYGASVMLANKRDIIMAPIGGSTPHFLIFNTDDNTADTSILSGGRYFSGGCLNHLGRAVFAPYLSQTSPATTHDVWGEYDPGTGKYEDTAVSSDAGSFEYLAPCPNGKLMTSGNSVNCVGLYNSATKTYTRGNGGNLISAAARAGQGLCFLDNDEITEVLTCASSVTTQIPIYNWKTDTHRFSNWGIGYSQKATSGNIILSGGITLQNRLMVFAPRTMPYWVIWNPVKERLHARISTGKSEDTNSSTTAFNGVGVDKRGNCFLAPRLASGTFDWLETFVPFTDSSIPASFLYARC